MYYLFIGPNKSLLGFFLTVGFPVNNQLPTDKDRSSFINLRPSFSFSREQREDKEGTTESLIWPIKKGGQKGAKAERLAARQGPNLDKDQTSS